MTFNARERAHELCQDIGGNCDKLTNALMLAYQAGTDARADEVARLTAERDRYREMWELRGTLEPEVVRLREKLVRFAKAGGTVGRAKCGICEMWIDTCDRGPTCVGKEMRAFLASRAATPLATSMLTGDEVASRSQDATPPAPDGERPVCKLCDVGVPWCRTPCDGCPNPGAWEARRAKHYPPPAEVPGEAGPTPCGHATGTYQTSDGRMACLDCSLILMTPTENP